MSDSTSPVAKKYRFLIILTVAYVLLYMLSYLPMPSHLLIYATGVRLIVLGGIDIELIRKGHTSAALFVSLGIAIIVVNQLMLLDLL